MRPRFEEKSRLRPNNLREFPTPVILDQARGEAPFRKKSSRIFVEARGREGMGRMAAWLDSAGGGGWGAGRWRLAAG